MHIKSCALAASLLFLAAGPVSAGEADARAAQVMWNGWVCSIYAELKGDATEQERLFTLGYEKGQQFVEAAAAGNITPEEGRTMIPMVVGMLMAGPTHEFILGRIFEAAAGQGFEDVVAEDASGMPVEPADHVHDEGLRVLIATERYARSNCELIR